MSDWIAKEDGTHERVVGPLFGRVSPWLWILMHVPTGEMLHRGYCQGGIEDGKAQCDKFLGPEQTLMERG